MTAFTNSHILKQYKNEILKCKLMALYSYQPIHKFITMPYKIIKIVIILPTKHARSERYYVMQLDHDERIAEKTDV